MRFLCLFFMVTAAAFSQPAWSPLPNIPISGTFNRYDDVFFLDENLGWAANGSDATIYKTVDGGENWILQFSEADLGSPNYYFRNVEFLNENIGFVGTLNGEFFKTSNGGTSWELVTNIPTNPVAICGLDCVGANTIYGCGAYFWPAFIIKSSDSGATWTFKDMSAYADALVEVLFVDENIGFASGQKDGVGGIILKTEDGGETWSNIYNTNINGEYVWKLQILSDNPNIIFASVESIAPMNGKLLKSIDFGVSWISKEVPDSNIQAVGFVSASHGFMGGHHTGFLETFNAGTTWTPTAVGSNLNRIFFIGNIAYAAGSTIYKFSDNLAVPDFPEHPRKALQAIISPNPVKDKLNISVEFLQSDHIRFELFDSDGRMLSELYNAEISGGGLKRFSFDFKFPTGSYILNMHTNTGRQSIKFVH